MNRQAFTAISPLLLVGLFAIALVASAAAPAFAGSSGTWTRTGSMTTGRGGHTATPTPTAVPQTATPTPTTVSQASGTWATTGSMKTAREGQTATLLSNGLVLVAGGLDGTTDLASAELYNPATGKWTATGSLNVARTDHTATLLPNGQVLVAGGDVFSSATGFTTLSSAELYDPATSQWTVTGSLNTAREAHTATLLPNGQVLIAGGDAFVNNSLVIFSSAELYNPSTGAWTKTSSMSVPREQHTATLLTNGQVLVAGGYNDADPFNHSLSSAELYNPATGKWTLTGSLNTARYAHKAVLLANGQVLVVDGTDVSSAGTFDLNSTELYNPATAKWTTTGNTFHTGNSAFSVTLLNTGKVLIAGGIVGVYPNEHITSAAELYDPSTSTSAFTGSLNVPRNDQSATLLPNGQVLAAGGQTTTSNGSVDVASAELYTP